MHKKKPIQLLVNKLMPLELNQLVKAQKEYQHFFLKNIRKLKVKTKKLDCFFE